MITAKDSCSQQHWVPPGVEASLLLCAVQSKPGFRGTAAQSSSHNLASVVLQPSQSLHFVVLQQPSQSLDFVVLQPSQSLAFVVLQPSQSLAFVILHPSQSYEGLVAWSHEALVVWKPWDPEKQEKYSQNKS